MDYEDIKKSVGKYATQFIPRDTPSIIGLGTGSTASAFVSALIELHSKSPLPIHCVATSLATEEQARVGNLPMVSDFSKPLHIDITFDGADWITPDKLVLKGLGGAALREKVVAYASKKLILLIDDRKMCNSLENKILPVEIIPFAHCTTIEHIQRIGCTGSIRTTNNNGYFHTDNHNFIFDVQIPPERNLLELEAGIRAIPGVVETGLFKNFSPIVIVGNLDGSIQKW